MDTTKNEVIENKTIMVEKKKGLKLPFGYKLEREPKPAKTDGEDCEGKPKKILKKVGIGLGCAAAAVGLVGAGIALGSVPGEKGEDLDDEIIDVDPVTEDTE